MQSHLCTVGASMQLDAEFQDTDQLGESEWQEQPPQSFDAVTCMFAVHYFFASEQKLKALLHNVNINLKLSETLHCIVSLVHITYTISVHTCLYDNNTAPAANGLYTVCPCIVLPACPYGHWNASCRRYSSGSVALAVLLPLHHVKRLFK